MQICLSTGRETEFIWSGLIYATTILYIWSGTLQACSAACWKGSGVASIGYSCSWHQLAAMLCIQFLVIFSKPSLARDEWYETKGDHLASV